MLYCRYHLNKRQIFNLIFVKMYSTLLVENRIFRFVCVNDIFNYTHSINRINSILKIFGLKHTNCAASHSWHGLRD